MYCEISEDSGASLFDGREDVITLVEKEVSSFFSWNLNANVWRLFVTRGDINLGQDGTPWYRLASTVHWNVMVPLY